MFRHHKSPKTDRDLNSEHVNKIQTTHISIVTESSMSFWDRNMYMGAHRASAPVTKATQVNPNVDIRKVLLLEGKIKILLISSLHYIVIIRSTAVLPQIISHKTCQRILSSSSSSSAAALTVSTST